MFIINHSFLHLKGASLWGVGVKENSNPLMMEGVKEIRQPLTGGGGEKQFVSNGQNQHYITINKIFFANVFGVMCHLSHINKVFILTQPFYQYLCNIFHSLIRNMKA